MMVYIWKKNAVYVEEKRANVKEQCVNMCEYGRNSCILVSIGVVLAMDRDERVS